MAPIDYRSMKEKRPGEEGKERKPSPLDARGYWWRFEGKALGDAVIRAASHIEQQQGYRTQANLRHSRIYGNFDAVGFGPRDYSQSISGLRTQISLNVIAACVDTLCAKVSKNRPQPFFQTYGGDWKLQRKGLKLNKFCQGAFHETELYRHAQMAFKDACIMGTGALKFLEGDNERLVVERAFPENIKVDDADGMHGSPRQLYEYRLIPREVLMEMYGGDATQLGCEIAAAIEAAQAPRGTHGPTQGLGDVLPVWEVWHLPSGRNANDGRHAIAIKGATLFEEEWSKPRFPFSFIHYTRRQLGFWGQGLAERLWGIQLEINRTARAIQEILRMLSNPKILRERSSNIPKQHLRGGWDSIGDIIDYTGVKPEIWTPQAVAPEHFAQLDRLWQKSFEQEGISQLSASATKPSGLDSRPALREYNDIESERFAILGQDWERFVALDSAEILIDMAKDIAKGKKDYEVQTPLRRALEPVKWSDIDLERDQYVMQALPVSSLPNNPAARLEMVQEWVDRGWVDNVEARRLMNMPDLETADSLATAAMDDVDATIEMVLDGEEPATPDETQNLSLLATRTQSALLRAKHQGATDQVLTGLRNLLMDTQNAQQALAQAAQAMQPQQGMPAAAPMPTGQLAGPASVGPQAAAMPMGAPTQLQ